MLVASCSCSEGADWREHSGHQGFDEGRHVLGSQSPKVSHLKLFVTQTWRTQHRYCSLLKIFNLLGPLVPPFLELYIFFKTLIEKQRYALLTLVRCRVSVMDQDQDLDSHNSRLPVSPRFQQDSSRSLSHQVPSESLQGIPFRYLLARAGRPFKAEDFSVGRRNLRQCLDFDAFISHDWQTSHWLKYGSLLLLFNVKAAAVAILLFSTAGGFLIQYKVLPQTGWAVSIGYLVFVCLCDFPGFLARHSRSVPQAKVGVSRQADHTTGRPESKRNVHSWTGGILETLEEIGDFVSESYIDRVWCVYDYEFATFMRIHRGERPV